MTDAAQPITSETPASEATTAAPATAESPAPAPIRSYADIRGWFNQMDKQLFDTILDSQPDEGTLVEVGAYLGRSAVVIEDHRRNNERFVVVDLFGSDDGLDDEREDSANRRENAGSYATLTRDQFKTMSTLTSLD